MISISTPTIDTDGNVVLYNTSQSNLDKRDYRVSKSQTLDGGTVISHSGYAVGDRELTIKCDITESQADALKYIGDNYTSHIISMDEGIFYGAIKNINTKNGTLRMTVYLKEKDS